MILKRITELAKSCIEWITLKDSIILFKVKERFRSPEQTPAMKALTLIGSAGAIWMIPALPMLRERKTRLDALLAIYANAQNVITNNLVTKFFFRRERPCTRFPEEFILNSFPLGYSFPSGHALTSWCAATIYMLSDWKNAFWAVPLALGISFSRAYLFTHYPSDILIGALDGILSGWAIYKIGHWMYDEEVCPFFNNLVDADVLYEPKTYLELAKRLKKSKENEKRALQTSPTHV